MANHYFYIYLAIIDNDLEVKKKDIQNNNNKKKQG